MVPLSFDVVFCPPPFLFHLQD